MSEIKAIKRLSAELISKKGNRIRMIFASILLVFSVFLPIVLSLNVVWTLFGDTDAWLADALFVCDWLLLSLVITMPIVAAIYRYCFRVYLRTRDGLDALEYTPTFGRCFRAGVLILSRPLAVLLIFFSAYKLAEIKEFLFYIPLMALAAVLSVLFMYLTGGAFFIPYFFSMGMKPSAALSRSRALMKRNRKIYMAYMISFVGMILLSVITVGIFFMVHALPIMMFTYFILADRILCKQQAKETKT